MFHEIFFYANHTSSVVNDNVQFKSTFNKMHCNEMQTATTKFHYYVDDSISIVKIRIPMILINYMNTNMFNKVNDFNSEPTYSHKYKR